MKMPCARGKFATEIVAVTVFVAASIVDTVLDIKLVT